MRGAFTPLMKPNEPALAIRSFGFLFDNILNDLRKDLNRLFELVKTLFKSFDLLH